MSPIQTPPAATASDPARPLAGKCALVTGSTSGIGLGIARTLAAQGADVVLNGFGPPDAIEAAQAEIRERFGVSTAYSAADMSDEGAIASMFEMITEGGTRRLDILVNNAGVQHVAPIEAFPPEKWSQILAINLTAAFHTMRLALPSMRRNGYGRIINVASAHGLVASPFKSAYVAAKHGLLGLTKTVALETAEADITCNAICPGYIDTPWFDDPTSPASRDRLREATIKATPLRAASTAEDVADATLFLASPQSRHVTGETLLVDAGTHLGFASLSMR